MYYIACDNNLNAWRLKIMSLQEQFCIDSDGKKKSVIIPLEQYEHLLEDLHDLAKVAERRSEETVDIDEMKQLLKKDGVL